jgi:hypothetical protein
MAPPPLKVHKLTAAQRLIRLQHLIGSLLHDRQPVSLECFQSPAEMKGEREWVGVCMCPILMGMQIDGGKCVAGSRG